MCTIISLTVFLGCTEKGTETIIHTPVQYTPTSIQYTPYPNPVTTTPAPNPPGGYIWNQNEITALNMKDEDGPVNIYERTINYKSPFYNGPIPFKATVAIDRRGEILFFIFDDFAEMFIYKETKNRYEYGIPDGAIVMGRDENPKPLAEAKVLDIIENEGGSRSIIISEVHYDRNGNSIFSAESVINNVADMGFKFEERKVVGVKEKEYFFAYPIDFYPMK